MKHELKLQQQRSTEAFNFIHHRLSRRPVPISQ